jgi:hypothetical protein
MGIFCCVIVETSGRMKSHETGLGLSLMGFYAARDHEVKNPKRGAAQTARSKPIRLPLD